MGAGGPAPASGLVSRTELGSCSDPRAGWKKSGRWQVHCPEPPALPAQPCPSSPSSGSGGRRAPPGGPSSGQSPLSQDAAPSAAARTKPGTLRPPQTRGEAVRAAGSCTQPQRAPVQDRARSSAGHVRRHRLNGPVIAAGAPRRGRAPSLAAARGSESLLQTHARTGVPQRLYKHPPPCPRCWHGRAGPAASTRGESEGLGSSRPAVAAR